MANKKTQANAKEKATEKVAVKEEAVTPKEAITTTPKSVTSTQTESQTVAPETVALQSKQPKKFTAYLQAEEAYDEKTALDTLRMKLRSYKEIHAGFLSYTEEADAFVVKQEFLPVYRQSALVDYAWSIKNKGEKTTHSERREVSCRQHTAPAFFKADVFPAGDENQDAYRP